jgi:4-hydroxythreonine-4-phosphate dehydrogenase
MNPIIAITMGDAAGIGPEIIAKTLALKEIYTLCKPIVIGDSNAIKMGLEVAGIQLKVKSLKNVKDAQFKFGKIDVLDLHNIEINKIVMGKPQAMAGKASVDYVKKAAKLALEGNVDAIVTAPLNKEAMKMAGIPYIGHTELLADLSKTKDYAMMLASGSLKVVHVTTHVALKEVPDLITKERVLNKIKLADSTLRSLGVKTPKIGVAGLNPHSGEGGLLGMEEINEIRPAVEEAKRIGLDVEGPLPPDTIFSRAAGGGYDVVVAMYHDQGHIPVKQMGFKWETDSEGWSEVSGVNVTIGLPFIRTSVDHGTAYGKAGRKDGTANPQSLIDAIKIAVNMAKMRAHSFKI